MKTNCCDAQESSTWYGRASLDPSRPITAGQVGTWTISYTVGRYGVDNGGRIKVAMRLASDWAEPQMADPQAPHYLTVSTTGDARLRAVFEPKGHMRPWFKVTTIYVLDGSLKEGDQVFITYGDTSGGGPGTRAQTFRESAFEFRVLVESFETNIFVRVPSSPRVEIRGGDARRLVLIAPGHVTTGVPFSVTLNAEDGWGNPASSYAGVVNLSSEVPVDGLPETVAFDRGAEAVRKISGLTALQGRLRITARNEDLGEARSNPIECFSADPEFRLFWADLHGQTDSTVGTGSVEEYFNFARDIGCVDVCTHQGNDFQITREDWKEITEETRDFHAPGEFVTFLGYEWSGNTPAGGDHNVIYMQDDQPIYRSSHWQVSDLSDAHLDRYPVDRLYDTLRGWDAIIIPHIGGRRASLDYHDPELEPVIEICSVHGRFEWFLQEAFEKGHRVGVIGAGDDHTGRPGASYGTSASFGVRGGLAGILARSLTREGIWEALKARRTYATTGERILLSVMSGQHHMGEAFTCAGRPRIEVSVHGTAPLYSVQVIRGDRVVYDHELVRPADHTTGKIRVTWRGARLKSRGRHTNWEGSLKIADGNFGSVTEFAFDNPRQGVTHSSDKEIRWSSMTSGDLDGLIVGVDGADNPRFRFESEPISFSFTLSELRSGPITREAGRVDQRVEVSLARAKPGPEEVEFIFADEEVGRGTHPYYVRVTQEDGEMAWSSPLYVDVRPDT